MSETNGIGKVGAGEEFPPITSTDEPLREEDVLREDVLDDRVEEGEGLPEAG